jgi:oxygen-dependent protoporphyrinogen oxidase
MSKKVAIIGGGIAGLAAAYYLQKKVQEENLPFELMLIESSDRLGGKIQTVKRDGFVIEAGPDSFLARKESAGRFVKEVGLADRLTNNQAGQAFILANQKLHPIPSGAVMGVPTQVTPFAFSSLFSTKGKLRAGADLFLPRSDKNGDQSLGEFFRRRLGSEVVENLIEPLLSGIYAGDIDRLSLMSTFPQFYEVEKKHRSLILGMKSLSPKRPATAKKKGMFQTLTTGLQALVEAVESTIERNVEIQKSTSVTAIKKVNEKYQLSLSNGDEAMADSVIVASPHRAVASMLSEFQFMAPFNEMPSTSVATVAMAFPKEAIENNHEGTGFVVSRNSDYTITACTWTHKKWPHSTPDGKVLLRCYVGRAGAEEIVDQSDEKITEVVLHDLRKTMRVTAEPDFVIVSRWKNAMPQYTVGHKQRIETIKRELNAELPGVFLAGGSYEGLGLPDCIDQGEEAVEKVTNHLSLLKKN